MTRYSLIFLLFFTSIGFSNAQGFNIDSLQDVLVNHFEEDTVKVNLLLAIVKHSDNYDEESLIYSQKALSLSEKLDFQRGRAKSMAALGTYYYYKSVYKKANEYQQFGNGLRF